MSFETLDSDHTLARAAKMFGYNHVFVNNKQRSNIETFARDTDDMESYLQELGLTKKEWYVGGGDFAVQRQFYQVFFAIREPKIASLFKLRFL